MDVRSAFAEGQGVRRMEYLERQWASIHKKPTLTAIRRMARELGRLFPDAEILEEAAEVARTKRADYTNGGDRFANFRQRAAELNCPIFLVWSVYAGKHLDALRTWNATKKLESEPVVGRVVDLLNYLDLLEGMLLAGVVT